MKDTAFMLPTQRPRDGYGSGDYGASRGSRKHKGIDLMMSPGYPVRAPRSGKIHRIAGRPYAADTPEHQHMLYVSLTDDYGFRHRLMYVKAAQGLQKNQSVRAGDIIGYAQGLGYLYPGMFEHVHYEVRHGATYFHPFDFSGMRKFIEDQNENT